MASITGRLEHLEKAMDRSTRRGCPACGAHSSFGVMYLYFHIADGDACPTCNGPCQDARPDRCPVCDELFKFNRTSEEWEEIKRELELAGEELSSPPRLAWPTGRPADSD